MNVLHRVHGINIRTPAQCVYHYTAVLSMKSGHTHPNLPAGTGTYISNSNEKSQTIHK